MLLAHFGFKKVKNPDSVCKSVRRYVAGTKKGHLTGPFWACVKMTVDTLLAKKGHLTSPKVSVDTLLGPKMVTLPVHYGHVSK